MNRKLLGGLAALVALAAVLAGVWLFALRGKQSVAAREDKPRSAEIETKPLSAKSVEDKAPRGAAPHWTMDDDREGPLRLEGQVQDPDGKAVANANVEIDTVPKRKATTEEDGTFSFDKLVARTYDLTAESGELVGGPVTYKLTGTSDPVVLRLRAGAAVSVTVVDEAKKPVAGAKVRRDDTDYTTDAKGIVTVKPVRPGWVSVVASANGYADEVGFTTIGAGGAVGSITIVLRRGFAVAGRVIDEAGTPIAKVKIETRSGPWDFGGGRDRDPVVTDENGAFKIRALAAGQHTLSAVDGEHAPASSAAFVISTRPISDLTITMKEGAVLAGKVVTADRKVSPYATVRVAGKGGNPWERTARQTTTDETGAFELRGLARGAVQARAESDEAASKVTEVDLSEKLQVKDVVLTLDVTGVISGVVVSETGVPVPEVQVNAFPDVLGGGNTEGLAVAGMTSATTDGAGAFTMHGLGDGSYRLWAARARTEFGGWGNHGVSAKVGDKNVKLTLPAPGGLTGSIVLDGASAPPSPAYVAVGQHPQTPVSGDGKFLLQELEPGTYDVTFRGPQFAAITKRDIKIEPGKTTDMGVVTVERGRKVTGKVTDKSGAPVPGAKVRLGEMLFSAEGSEGQTESIEDLYGVRSALTDQAGEFSIIGVTEKPTNAVAEHPDLGRSVGVPIPGGVDDPRPIILKLRGFGSIAGSVTMKGKPQGGVTVSQTIKGGMSAMGIATTTDDGTFIMSKVPEGEVVLQAMQSQMMSMRTTSVVATVVAGQQAKVVIDIPVGSVTLTVKVVPKPGAQVDSAQVFLFRGSVAFTNGKEVTDGFMQGGAQGMKFWLGGAMPGPTFDELVAGDYSVCTIPLTGSLQDPTFQQRIQENIASLAVYCKAVRVTPTPTAQTVTSEVPAMNPLPAPT